MTPQHTCRLSRRGLPWRNAKPLRSVSSSRQHSASPDAPDRHVWPLSKAQGLPPRPAVFDHVPDLPPASLVAQRLETLPAMQETQVRSLGWEVPLEKGMATYFSIPA